MLGEVIRGNKVIYQRDLALRIDGENTGRHRLDFQRPHCALQGVDLAVGVGDTDIIQIDQRQMANPGACQRLCRPRTNAADPHHTDMGCGKTVQRRLTIQTGYPAKALQIFWTHHVLRPYAPPRTGCGV